MENFNAALVKQRMEQHIGTRLAEGRLAGVTAGVWLNGQQQLSVCMGQRDPAKGIAMTPDTIFRLASMTKPVAGTATMLQAEKGLIDLDAPISRWLPKFEHMQVAVGAPDGKFTATRPANRPITARMLLTHSSGLASGVAGYAQVEKMTREQRRDLASSVDAYADFALDFQPGENWMYSGMAGMDVLLRIVEKTSDMPCDEFIKKYILDPLEMPDTTYCPNAEQQARTMAFVDAREGVLHPVEISPLAGFDGFADGYTGGGAGLFSTLEDYSHLALMFAGSGEYKGRRILKKETVDAMATVQLPDAFEGLSRYFNWGLSMRVCRQQAPDTTPWPGQPLSAGAFGWSGAYGTHFWVDRTLGLVGVYMSNLLDGGGSGAPTAFEFEHDVMSGFVE